jgi:hypothetical protein
MKRIAIALLLLAAAAFPAMAQDYYDVDVNLPEYPEMQPVPDSPVYYAPAVDSNYFYYDGQYWDYYNDGWYSSAWYNGPWTYVDPVYVPTYILWVPISYYHHRPGYWHGWASNRPPHWGEHWGHDWQARHNQVYGGRNARPGQRAPLPTYQRHYTSQNYPRAPQQQMQIHNQNYRYQPREAVTMQHYQARAAGVPTQSAQRVAPPGAGGEHRGGGDRGGPQR